jgi:hypothetical protein
MLVNDLRSIAVLIGGTRRRRHSSLQSKRLWYAQYRQARFARRMLG